MGTDILVLLLLFIGLFGGLIAGMLGVGGGTFIVPCLYFLMKYLQIDPEINMHVAVGTSLAVMLVTSFSAGIAHHKRSSVDFDLMKSWIVTLSFGVLVGSLTAPFYKGKYLIALFTVFALATVAKMIYSKSTNTVHKLSLHPVALQIIVFFIGMLSSLMGIGGGIFFVPLMTWLGMKIHQAIGTSVAFGVIIACFGTLGFALSGQKYLGFGWPYMGYINVFYVLILATASWFGAKIGAKLAHKLSHDKLELIFGLFLLIIAIRMGSDLF